jgi:hypothetical protein
VLCVCVCVSGRSDLKGGDLTSQDTRASRACLLHIDNIPFVRHLLLALRSPPVLFFPAFVISDREASVSFTCLTN